MVDNTQLNAAVNEALTSELAGKKWYMSKTFWTNVVAGVAVVAQVRYGFVVSPEYQLIALSVINLGLRKITNQPVVW